MDEASLQNMKVHQSCGDKGFLKESYKKVDLVIIPVEWFHLALLSPSRHAMLVVSFPNSTAIKAAKAHRSARDFPDSLKIFVRSWNWSDDSHLKETSRLGEFPG